MEALAYLEAKKGDGYLDLQAAVEAVIAEGNVLIEADWEQD